MTMRILVISHGNFSKGLVHCAKVIMGESENISALSLNQEDSIDVFYKEFYKLIEFDAGKETLVLCDMVGGSPFNCLVRLKKQFPALQGVIGVNVPLFLEALNLRNTMDNKELAEYLNNMSAESIVNLTDFVAD